MRERRRPAPGTSRRTGPPGPSATTVAASRALALVGVVTALALAPVVAVATPDGAADGDAAASAPLVVFLGDSLTAGLGVAEQQAYPALVAERLAAEGHPIRLLNAGVSGDTTAGGLRRLEWLLAQHPDVVVVGLGANDGLRGLPIEETDANLRGIVTRAREGGCRVLLLGMLVPPNYGPDYAPQFAAVFPRVARELGVPLVPFLLEDVGGRPELNQADGIHPTAEGHRILARTVYPKLAKIVREIEEARGAGARGTGGA